MPTQTVNGATISYTETGQGPAIALVHGFPLDSRMWEHQLRHFSQSYRVVAPDLRGFGKSPSAQPFTIETLASDVQSLMRQLNAIPFILCGFSMGGYVSLAYTKLCPTDLRALVLVDTRAEADTTEGKANRNKMIELVRTSGSKAVAEQMLPKMLAPDTLRSRPQVAQAAMQMMENCPPLTIEHALAAMRDREDYTAGLPSIAIPSLIVVGEDDALTPPPLSRAMNENIPRSHLASIPRAGHLSPMEQPEAVNAAIEGFLKQLG